MHQCFHFNVIIIQISLNDIYLISIHTNMNIFERRHKGSSPCLFFGHTIYKIDNNNNGYTVYLISFHSYAKIYQNIYLVSVFDIIVLLLTLKHYKTNDLQLGIRVGFTHLDRGRGTSLATDQDSLCNLVTTKTPLSVPRPGRRVAAPLLIITRTR